MVNRCEKTKKHLPGYATHSARFKEINVPKVKRRFESLSHKWGQNATVIWNIKLKWGTFVVF